MDGWIVLYKPTYVPVKILNLTRTTKWNQCEHKDAFHIDISTWSSHYSFFFHFHVELIRQRQCGIQTDSVCAQLQEYCSTRRLRASWYWVFFWTLSPVNLDVPNNKSRCQRRCVGFCRARKSHMLGLIAICLFDHGFNSRLWLISSSLHISCYTEKIKINKTILWFVPRISPMWESDVRVVMICVGSRKSSWIIGAYL